MPGFGSRVLEYGDRRSLIPITAWRDGQTLEANQVLKRMEVIRVNSYKYLFLFVFLI